MNCQNRLVLTVSDAEIKLKSELQTWQGEVFSKPIFSCVDWASFDVRGFACEVWWDILLFTFHENYLVFDGWLFKDFVHFMSSNQRTIATAVVSMIPKISTQFIFNTNDDRITLTKPWKTIHSGRHLDRS